MDMVDAGVAPEDARAVLPNACCTELYMTANARALIEMSHLRMCKRAQREIRELFDKIRDCLCHVSPKTNDPSKFLREFFLPYFDLEDSLIWADHQDCYIEYRIAVLRMQTWSLSC